MQAFYADQFVLPLPAGHRFPMPKYRMLRERLYGVPEIRMGQALEASDGELALAHTPAYLSSVIEGTLSPAQQREVGFPWSEAMVARAALGRGDHPRRARRAERWHRRQPGRWHPPRHGRQGWWLLRLQRRGRGRAADAGRMAPHAPPAAARGGGRP